METNSSWFGNRNSALILRILDCLGYSLSYDEVKSLETVLAFSAKENDCDAPDGIELKPNLGTGLAWDNYDVNMETLDGKATLYATIGTCYQNITAAHSGRNRQQFNGRKCEIAPMYCQLNKATFDLSASDNQQETLATRVIDFYWLMQLQIMKQPLFAGHFLLFVHDDLPK